MPMTSQEMIKLLMKNGFKKITQLSTSGGRYE